MTMELQMLARACGKTNVHSLEPEDLAALTVEASAMARVPLAGTTYTVGQTEREILAEVQRLLAIKAEDELIANPTAQVDRPALGGRMSSHDLAYTEPEKIKSIDAEFLAGHRFPYQEDMSLLDDVDLMAATPGEDLNWLEDIALLEEDGMPAVFDRYSNAFLKIYFPIPEGREDEIARKVLVKHLTSGNSYGIQLKADHTKFPSPSSARGSPARRRSAPTTRRPSSRAGRSPPDTECCGQDPRDDPLKASASPPRRGITRRLPTVRGYGTRTKPLTRVVSPSPDVWKTSESTASNRPARRQECSRPRGSR